MKKSLLCFLILLMMPLASMAYDFEVGGIYYKFTDNSSVAVTYEVEPTWDSDYPAPYSGTITIPSTVNYNDKSYTVTSIGDSAFWFCSGLTSIDIPEGVTSIGDYAFVYCSGLTSINIPERVTSIGDDAFFGCSSLTSIDIPEGVTSIGDGTFARCSGLTSIDIPEGVTSIGDFTFGDCSGLTSITIPEGVTSIGEYAFGGCSGLTSIDIPEGVTSIGYRAFTGCYGLTSITIPEGVKSIGSFAFYACKSLTSVTIPESVTSIGGWAFFDCSGLTSVLCKSKEPASCDGSVFSSLEPRLIIPVGSEEAYASAKEWKEFTNHYVFKTFDHAVTTFADAEKIDLDKAYQVGDEKTLAAAAENDLKAYQFTGSVVDGTIYGTEVKGIVPEGTGLLMTGTAGATYVFPLASGDATADVSGNKLVGVTKDTDLSTLTDGDSHYVYDNDAFRLQSTGTIAANKAYLSLPTSGTDKINVTLGGATGIKGIAADNEDNGAWYTLDGVKVNEKPTAKGLYIHNGKKVVVNK